MSGRPARPAAALAAISGPKLSVNWAALISACPRATPMSCVSRSPGRTAAEEPVDLSQQFLDRLRLACHRLGPRHARQGFGAGGRIGRRIPVQHVQGAAIGTARLTWVARVPAQPPAAPEPCADQSPGVLPGDHSRARSKAWSESLSRPRNALTSASSTRSSGSTGSISHGLGQEAVCLRHRGDAAGVLGGGDEIGDGLLVLPGALEVAGDLGGPLAAVSGPGLLGALAQQPCRAPCS